MSGYKQLKDNEIRIVHTKKGIRISFGKNQFSTAQYLNYTYDIKENKFILIKTEKDSGYKIYTVPSTNVFRRTRYVIIPHKEMEGL